MHLIETLMTNHLKLTYPAYGHTSSSSAPFHPPFATSAAVGIHSLASTSDYVPNESASQNFNVSPTTDGLNSAVLGSKEITAACYFAVGAIIFGFETKNTCYFTTVYTALVAAIAH